MTASFTELALAPSDQRRDALLGKLVTFREFGQPTVQSVIKLADRRTVPVFVNEFWTAKQRAAHPLHEVSYRACFKPQLPRFFIEHLTQTGDLVYDPFMGRGTTLVEGALLGRRVTGCDINPLSRVFTAPRLAPPNLEAVAERLDSIDFTWDGAMKEDLCVFYHLSTLRQITALRSYLLKRITSGRADIIDHWIQMVATNRLTGHSPGFFSVYTLPPNQAVSIASQKRINAKRVQTPPQRDVPALILKKSRQLLALPRPASSGFCRPVLFSQSCETTPQLTDASVDLIVTSPPFLDTVDYAQDNWLRAWFCGFDLTDAPIWHLRNLADWTSAMTRIFRELHRVLRPDGFIAFEVGEVRGGKVRLEEQVLAAGTAAGLQPVLVLINSQQFTKTANCWGVSNNRKGTNTNRVVLFQKLA
ncbi:MAG: site-specific DNA-methyltransferase [Opitutaceae bacterium]|nr:site-specific DNA-methyltransferase [Opitutaceae bacterium]MBP9912710.1 site-specific DNA-methyltransferase [Opitutaceae bacterium]